MRMIRGLGLLAAIGVAGCLAPLPPEPLPVRPSASTTPAATPLSQSGPPVAEATPAPTEPPRDDRCAPLAFDALAVPGPEFAEDIFVNDESRTITEAFLVGLSSLYAGGSNVDRCDLLTDRGLATMLLADRHLAAADRRDLLVDTSLVLRVAFEDDYDLRIKPPRVPIDAIFDLPAGATLTDPHTAAAATTTKDERVGLRLVFAYDGHRWRVDEAGSVSTAHADWAILPGPLPPGPKCERFDRDPPGARYDDRQDRVWCDGNGKGHRLRIGQELSIITRYPCKGHATILQIGRPLGAPIDRLVQWEYVRDPNGEFAANGWLAAPYDGDTRLPKDAVATGWTNGNVDLWISPSNLDRGIYLVRGDVVERWARATGSWGVIDCN
jgi:hypothetical protein